VSALGSGFNLAQTVSGSGTVTNSVALNASSGSGLSPGNGVGAAGTLTIDSGLTESGGVNHQFYLSSPGGTNDLIAVLGPLTVSGANNITLSDFRGGTIPYGIYPLITYTGAFTGATNNFTVSAVGVTGTVTNITTVTPNEIAVIITPPFRSALNLTWVGDGVNNYWDTVSSGDWKNGAAFYTFQAGDSVLFTDSGAPNTNVLLQAAVLPAAVVVSNSTAELYTFTDNGTGLGNLSGATGLTKTNTGTLTILNSNTYTGITLVEEGALEVTNVVNGGLASAIGAATSDPSNLVFYASTFRFSGLVSAAMDRGMSNLGGETVDVTNATTTLTENGVVAGTGPLTKVGLGTLTLANANTYAGGTVLSNGILAAANQTANASGFGPTTSPISFYGGTLALYRNNGDDGSTTFSFSNPLIVPAGQTGVLDVFERGTLSSALTGGGTLNVSSAGARAAFSGNWSAFTGTVNITGTFRIANTFGYSNAVLNLSGGADLDGGTATGTYSSSPTFEVGELDATNLTTAATLGATSKPTPSPTWRVGWKNTTSTFDGTIENPSGGVASIIKVGAGAWLLGGQNTYTGSTTISNGTLALTNMTGSDGSIADTTNIFINSGAVLDVSAISTGALALNSGQTLSGAGTLNGSLSAASGTTLSPGVAGATGTFTINNSLTENGGVNHLFALSTGANPDLINVLGALNVSGFNNITLSEFGGGQIAPGTYPLISYPPGGLSGDISSFNLVDGGTVFFSGVLTNITTVTPNLIAVVILPLPPATNVTWVGDGVNNYWDYLTTNWAAGSTPMSFEPGDTVLFTDSGSASPPVNLTTTLYPAAVVVSNSTAEPYTFTDNGTGLGILGGSTSLTKTNTGTLTILNSNAYAGQTILGEGVMEVTNVNNSLEPSPLGAANNDPSNLVFYAGTLRYSGASAATDHGITSLGEATVDVTNASTTLTNNGPVAGAGGLIKVGLGTLSLGSAGNYTGGTIISNGVLALGSQNANNNGSGRGALGFATNPVSFMGGTLQLYGYGLSNTNDYNIFNNPLVVPTNQTGTLLMFPRTASSPGMLSSLTGGGTLTVVANFVRSWMGGNWSAFTGLIIVTNLNSGAAANVADSFEIDNSYGYSNATFWLQGAAVMDYALGANATIKIGALTGDPGTVLGSGNDTQPNPNYSVGWLNTTNLFAGAILDPTTNNGPFPGISTSITKVGSGSWYLGGTNTYTGSTTISNGTLGLTNVLGLANGGGDASIGASTNIFINSGAFLDVSGISSASLVLSNAQTLTGGGTILGALDTTLGGTGAGGTVSPGAAPSATGALTVTNNITLGGNVVMKLNYPASDKLVALGAGGITYGGTLTVTNIGGAIPVGAVFTLFSAPAFNASHFSGGTLPSSDYYSWDLSQLAVNGTIRVSAVAQPGISSANFSGLAGGSITLNATNGVPGGLVEILSTTNIALPFANWIPVLTNNFDLNGNLDIVITANPLTSQEYYILQAF
jgi:autotransporter-associated beta strand protein